MSDRISALATLLSTVEYDDVGSDVWYGVVSDKRKFFESESKKKDDDCIDSGITTSSSPLIKQSPRGGKEQQSSMQQQDQLRKYQRPAFIHQSPLGQQFQLGVEPDRKLTSSSTTRKDETCASNSIATEAIPTSQKNASTLICLVSLGCHDRLQSSNQNRSLSWLTTRKVPFVIVDGNDVTAREIRDELFEVSGIRANYPQFFIERHDGQIEYFGDFVRMETLNETSGLPAEVLEMHPELETWADITFESTYIDDEVTEAGNQKIEACDSTDGDSAGIQSTDTQLTVNDSTSLSYSHSDSVDNNNSNSGEDSSQRLYLQTNFLDQFADSLSKDEVHITGIQADEVKHDNKTTINRDEYRTLETKTKPIFKTAVSPSSNVQVDDQENITNGVFSPRTPRGIISQKAQSICTLEASPSSYNSRIGHGLKSSQGVTVIPPQSPLSRMRLALSPRSNEGKAATASAQLVYNNKVVKEMNCNIIPKSPRSKPPQSPRIVGTKTYINTPRVAESPRSLLQEGIASFDTTDFCHDFDEDDTDNEERSISTSTAEAYKDKSLHTPETRQSNSDEDNMQGQDINMNAINIRECDDLVGNEMILSLSTPRAHDTNEVNIIETDEETRTNSNLTSMHHMWLKQMQLTASIIERFQNDVGSFKAVMNQDGSNDMNKEGEDLLVAAARLAKSLDRFLIVERQGSNNNDSPGKMKAITLGKQDEQDEQDIHSANESQLTRPDAPSGSTDVVSSYIEQGISAPTGIEKEHPTVPLKLKEKPKLKISIAEFQEVNECEKQEDTIYMATEPSPCGGDDKSLFNGRSTKWTRNQTHMWNSPAKSILRLFGIVATKNKEDSTSFHSLSSK